MSDALFDVDPAARREPEPVEKVSTERRRTLRQLDALRAGTHPLGMLPKILPGHLPLHPDAPAADDRDATGARCGNCRFRQVLAYHNRSYAKCTFGRTEDRPAPRISHGTATDVRAWWPACRDWELGDQQLPDAMRWVPDVKEIR